MIRSMTGYGSASVHTGGADYLVELRAVNNRYLKTLMRLPDALQPLEAEIEIALRKRIDRGSVTVRVTMSEADEGSAHAVNTAVLQRYVDAVLAALPAGDARVRLDAAALLGLPGVLRQPGNEDERLERLRAAVLPLVDRAATSLIAMREREGAALAVDLMKHHAAIAERLALIEARAPQIVLQYEQRLRARIGAMVAEAGASVEPADLIREIAVYAERTDIAEEITRLRTHLDQFDGRVRDGAESVGRTLEFIGQEMLREANTIASKSPDAEVSRYAVEIKAAIDRIKEQVLNIE